MRARLSSLAFLSFLAGCSSSSSSNTSPTDGGVDSTSTGGDVGGADTTPNGGGDAATEAAVEVGGDTLDPSDPHAADRAACTFGTGAKVTDTLPITAAQRAAIPIKHVIVLMKENRAFDHIFGKLHDTVPDVEAIPSTFSNVGLTGETVTPAHADTTCIAHDPDHQWAGMHTQVDNGKMDGFVKSAGVTSGTDGHFALSYYDKTDLPFYYWLAGNFAIADRHFASVRSGTFPNRNFMLLGTADGVTSTGAGFPDPSTPTIFNSLDAAGITWGVYGDGSLLSGTLDWTLAHAGAHHFADFLTALDNGTLPAVSFVDGIDNVEDEHPTANVQLGEAWTRNIYEHAIKSPHWADTAILWTYDEAGGFFDHVPPPNIACVARPDKTIDAKFTELGIRIPLIAISPWAKAKKVSHVMHDHTAITRFIEAVFDLPALTHRDANSDALMDLFDFTASTAPLLTPPDAPASGTGGCVGGTTMTSAKPNYTSGESISLSFANAPGTNPKDWIAVYPYPATGPTPPGPNPLLSIYVGGTAAPSTSPASGTVTLDAGAKGTSGTWPLPVGGYIAYYLLDGGYTSLASIDFNVQ
jgi:phospholipase C